MAIGVDIGAGGTRTIDSRLESIRHWVPPGRQRTFGDLASRVGDPVPLVSWDEAGVPSRVSAHTLYAHEVARALSSRGIDVEEHDGRGITVATPAWWTARATASVRSAIRSAVGRRVQVIPDAEAAVRGHVASGESLDDIVAVLDVGARTANTAIVEGCASARPRLVRRTAVCVDGAGDDLDRQLLHHLLDVLSEQHLSPPRSVDATCQLLEQICGVKHALSTHSAADLVTDLTGADTALRLVRDELEELARPWAGAMVSALSRAIEASGLPVDSVLLVGGGAHVPLIAQTISAELQIDVCPARNPLTTTATGAMVSASSAFRGVPVPRIPSLPHPRRWVHPSVKGRPITGTVLTLPQPTRPAAQNMSGTSDHNAADASAAAAS